MRVPVLLIRLSRACARHAVLVVVAGCVLAGLSGAAAYFRLGATTDLNTLFAASLPWKQRDTQFRRLFPQFDNLLVAVVDARSPEQADSTASGLAQALAADAAHFHTVRRPDASPFFEREGLLFLDTKVLEDLLNKTVDAQPFLGQLAADPSARGLFAALSLIGVGVQQGQADLTPFEPALRSFHAALASALAGKPEPLSWQTLLSGPATALAGKYRFVLAQPVLDYGALQPGGAATAALRDAAARLEFVSAGAARVRVTGPVALSDEEFASAAHGAVVGLAASSGLVVVLLFLAVRSWRLVLPVLFTLVLGLLLTTAFAALAVGTLNLISVAFAVLFIGIAVDFSIQFSVRDREMRHEIPDALRALERTAGRAGAQILVAALATAAGFLAFVPTDFAGVAELGLIAGVGMLIAFVCTLTFLPAALTLTAPRAEPGEVGFAWGHGADRALVRLRWPILFVAAVAAVAGAASVPALSFDSDPLHVKNPHTEAMETLADLSQSPLTTPYTIDALLPDPAAAAAAAGRAAGLPLVAQALSIDSFVPTGQDAKLALIRDAASVLAPTLTARPVPAPVTAQDLRMGARTARNALQAVLPRLPPGAPLADIVGDLAKLETAPDAVLLDANATLTRFLPLQLDRLRLALSAGPVTLATVPPSIKRDWLLPDGRARVQVVARPGAQDSVGLRQFVDQVSAVLPDAGGSAVTIAATAQTIIRAFQQAAASAVVAIAVLLFVALRRPVDVLLVLAPLVLSAALTVLVVAWLPLPLNFANIIALPLLLGVGVSFNIYFVMNWRRGERDRLGSATARAVIFSAFTTATAFGSLSLSDHPGTASMGDLLLLSLGCTLLATLVFMPALLSTVTPRRPPR